MPLSDWDTKAAWMRIVGATRATFDAQTGALVSVELAPVAPADPDDAQHDPAPPARVDTAPAVSRAAARLVPRAPSDGS